MKILKVMLLLLLLPSTSWSENYTPDGVTPEGFSTKKATSHTGKIAQVMFFSNNWTNYNPNDKSFMVFYMTPSLSTACGGSEGRVAIASDHRLYESVVSAVLSAKMSQQPIHIEHLNTCALRYNAWDFGYLRMD
ncbi:hypothetical protein TUM4438_46370 [Shewanella sairae]|uniref:Uncharacterized protein n=1 Tax=Shewanella sairae TaxID=190310 RepID=A0ABQ4PSX8_9GAMM|nr:hypothetical protein [Shewanella sairae]MCL1132617.1 hypothetical protein [Shewanella sairae]GIU52838.1 hypothetical protein TUM4438_46370 [Shewanella sairae]